MDLTPASIVSGPVLRRAGPWIVVLLPPLAWFTFELGMVVVLRVSCRAADPGLGLAWGAGAVGACVVAALLGRAITRDAHDDAASRTWLTRVATVAAVIFALAIGFQTLATTIVPPCAR